MRIESESFRVRRFTCYTLMLLHQATGLAWIFGIVAVALAATGFIISPWIGLVALGLDAFLAVMVYTFVITAYGFNSLTGCNMPLHRLVVDGEYLAVEFEEGSPLAIPRKEVRPYKIYPGGALLPIGGSRPGWVWLPPKAFGNPDDFKNFIKQLYESNPGKE